MRTEKIPVDTSVYGDIEALFPPTARSRDAHAPADEPPLPSGPGDYGLQDDQTSGAANPAPSSPSATGTKPKFELLAFNDIHVDTKRRGYLVKGLLASTGLTVIWGPPKCGKSFWAVDIGLHIALEWEYRGRRVQQGTVVYIALEGRHGFPARIEAFRRHHGIGTAPFYLVTASLNLIVDAPALIACIKTQLGVTRAGVVFIDTLNRSLVGSESKDEDMSKYLAAAEKVEQELGCAVVIVHHCGIDASRPRGHTSLSGSVESQLAVKRGAAGEVIVTVELAKDFAEGAEIFSRLESVDVGTDPDGDPITSLVVVPTEASEQAKPGRKVTGAKKVALDILRKAIDEAPSTAPASNHIPANTGTTLVETWRTYAYQASISESDKQDTRKRAFARAAEKLQAANLIGIWGDYVWIT
jgi:hypothetical protein